MIAEGVKLDNQIQLRHNVQIGAAHGHRRLYRDFRQYAHRRTLHDRRQCGFVGHLAICDDTVITGMSMVSHSISTPGVYSGGIPSSPAALWRRWLAA